MDLRRLDGPRFLEAARDEPFPHRANILVEVLSAMVEADALMVGGRLVAPEVAHDANEALKAIAEVLFSGLLEESPPATREAVLAVPGSARPRRIDFDAWLERAPEEGELVPMGVVCISTVEEWFGVTLPSQLRLEWSQALSASDAQPFRCGSLTALTREARALERWLVQLGELEDEFEGESVAVARGRPRVLPFADWVDDESGNCDTVVLDLTHSDGEDFRVLIATLETDAVQEFATSQEFLQREVRDRPQAPIRATEEHTQSPPSPEERCRPPSLEERCRQASGSPSAGALVKECIGIARSQSGEQIVVALECLLRLGAGGSVADELDHDSLALRAGASLAREVEALLTRLRAR